MISLRHILTNCIKECNFLLTEEEVNSYVEKILSTSTIHYKNDGSELLLEGGNNDIGIPQNIWDKALKTPKYLSFCLTELDPNTYTRYCRLKGYTSFRDLEYDMMRGNVWGFEPQPYEIVLINGVVQNYTRKELEGFHFTPYFVEWGNINPYRLQYKIEDETIMIEFNSIEAVKQHLLTFDIPLDGDIHQVEVFCMQDYVHVDFVITDVVWDSRIPGPGGKKIQIDIE